MPSVIRHAIEAIRSDLGRRLTLADLSPIVGRSPWYLNVTFYQSTGMTIHEYATSQRLGQAAREIKRGVKIEAVARSVGYRSRQTFYRQFKMWFGLNPTCLRDSDPGFDTRETRALHCPPTCASDVSAVTSPRRKTDR